MKLFEDLFYYPWGNPAENNCNSYLIDGDCTTLIDGGHLRHIAGLFGTMKKDGASPDTITMVVSTHLHPDHHEGVAALSGRDIVIAFHREEERHLREFGYQLYQAMRLTIPPVKPQCYLTEGILLLGKKEFEIYHTPGHSPGSISLYWKERKALFTGDVLFAQGVGRTDFYEGDSSLLKESIARLSRLDVEYLLPGHGRIIQGKEAVQKNLHWIQERIFPLM